MAPLNEKQQLIVGEWRLDSSENFDAYLKEIGLNLIKRKLAANTKPSLKMEFDGENWTVAVESTFKNEQWKFKVGEKAKFTTIDGREFWTVPELTEDGKFIEHQSNVDGDNSVPSTITRYVDSEGRLIAELQANKVSAKRVYVRA